MGYVEENLDIPDKDIIKLLNYGHIFGSHKIGYYRDFPLLDENGKMDEKKFNKVYKENLEEDVTK